MTATRTPGQVAAHTAEPAQAELILSQMESLLALPELAARLLELTAGDTASASDVVELIESDEGLSARIASTVSRQDMGATAGTVDRAVALLGSDAVRSLVLSIQVFETFSRRAESAPSRLDRVGFWKHSLGVACVARLLAEAKATQAGSVSAAALNPEEVFACGLLHDLGKVALDACFPKSYDRVVAKVEASRGCIADVEREVFGLDHTVAGQRLAAHWKLPAMIRESIWLHHQTPASTPAGIAHGEHVRLVQAADRLARQMRIGYSGNHSGDGSLSAIAEAAGLTTEQAHQVTSALPNLMEARAALIGLDRLTSGQVDPEGLAETNAELARVNRSLAQTNRGLQQRSRCFEALRALSVGLGDEPMHEDICRAAAKSVVLVTQIGPAAVCGFSARRSILVIAAPGQEESAPSVTVLPASAAGDVSSLSDLGGAWLRASTLPGPLLDCLLAALGKPVLWYWPVRHRRRLMGAVVIGSDPRAGSDESLAAFSDSLGVWLSGAESRAVARQLNQELAEMNRRLVVSQSDLARMRSLAMVGEMASGAAHELNNPLAVICGRAQMLTGEEVSEEARRMAVVIAEQAYRASAIVEELMDFAKPARPAPTEWSLAELLGEIRREWLEKSSLTEEQFRLDLSDDLPGIRADAPQIKRLFDEVIRNAVEAMGDVSDPTLIINCQGDLADDRAVIRIEDNGCGMTLDVLERAMVPFFSHRPAGRGRGLGLSRAARYAEINGGRIRLSSEVGEGTAVFVELPAPTKG